MVSFSWITKHTCRVQLANSEFQRQFNCMSSVVENRQNESVAGDIELTLDHQIGKLRSSLNVPINVIFFIALRSNTSIPFGVFRKAKKRVVSKLWKKFHMIA